MNIGFSKRIQVPEDLSCVTTYNPGDEVKPSEAGLSEEAVKQIWTSVEDVYRTGINPAITFCLRRKGKIVLKRGIGYARGNGPDDDPYADKVPVTPDTPICQFSASKAVTALLVHLLVERHEINLNDPVSHYIPEFAANGKANTTIYHILSHHGGIPTIPEKVDPEVLFDYDYILKILCNAKPTSPGGRRMAYHAITGGFVLGEIIRRVTGNDIRLFLHENIKKPLGLKYFSYGVPDDEIGDIALNYSTGLPIFFPFSTIVENALSAPWDQVVRVSNDPRFMKIIIPAGNLVATADEMSQFFQLLLNDGELNGVRIFEPLTVKRSIMESDATHFDSTMILPMRYSAGLMLGNSPAGLFGPFTQQAYGHIGFINIFCWADPERDISVAFLTTGKALLGPHLLPIARMLATISWYCRKGAGLSEMTDFWVTHVMPVYKILQSSFLRW